MRVLSVYYNKKLVEQYFDLSKGSSKLIPIRVHSEEVLRRHLLLSMIATTINLHLQKRTNLLATNQVVVFKGLRNQKCLVYKIVTSDDEHQKKLMISIRYLICNVFFHISKAVMIRNQNITSKIMKMKRS